MLYGIVGTIPGREMGHGDRMKTKAERKEKFWMWIVWKMPSKVIYWASIRLIAFATTGMYSKTIVPDLTAMDALKRYGAQHGI